MAYTYGSISSCKVGNGSTRSEYQCRLGYQVNSQSIASNTSNVTLRLECRSTSSSYKTYGYNQTTTIDGTSLGAKSFDMRSTNTWQVFGERTITVSHNTNGSYSASKSGSFTTTASSTYSLKSGSASVTVAPATIPRYATSNQSLNSKTSSSITMNWWSNNTIDYIWYSTNNGASWAGVSIAEGTSGAYTISELSANTTYNIKTRVRRKDSQLTTDSGTLSVTTYQKTTAGISVSSKAETSITVNSSSNVSVSSTRYRIKTSSGSYGSWQTSNVFSNLSANTSYNIQVEKKGSESGEYGYADITVATYNYPYCTSAPDFKIDETVTLQFYNPLNRTFQIQMWSWVSQQFVSDLISVSETSYTGFDSFIDRRYASIPSNTSSRYNIDVHYSGNKEIKEGGYYSTKGTEKPIFSNFNYEDTNETTKKLTHNKQILINGYSNLKVTIPVTYKAEPQKSAEMKRYRLNVGTMTSVEADYSETDEVSMSINSVNNPNIIVTAIDSREYSTQFPKTATFKDYFKPIIKNVAVSRKDGVGEEVTLAFDGTFWNDYFGDKDDPECVHNSIKDISYYYKSTGDWIKGTTTITATTNNNNFTGSIEIDGPTEEKGFDVSTSYSIKLLVTDELDTSSEVTITLGKGTPVIAVFEESVAIGQMYDEELGGTLQVDGYSVGESLNYINNSVGNITNEINNINSKFNNYLPLSGGVINGSLTATQFNGDLNGNAKTANKANQIISTLNGNWINGVKNAPLQNIADVDGTDTYRSVLTQRSSGGYWSIGNLASNNFLDFIWVNKSNYDANNNNVDVRVRLNNINGEIAFNPVSLYANSSGSNGTITLTQSVTDFTYIEIFYRDNNGKDYGYQRFYNSNGQIIALACTEPNGSNLYIRTNRYKISANTISRDSSTYTKLISGSSVSGTTGNYVYITKVNGVYR